MISTTVTARAAGRNPGLCAPPGTALPPLRRLAIASASAAALLWGGVTTAQAHEPDADDGPLIVTASNATTNQLLVFSPAGTLLKTLPTQGQGGVGGNAGGVAAAHGRVAVVNFGSNNVSVFGRDDEHRYLRLEGVVATHGSPVSVAFGADHLYVLTTTMVESHAIGPHGVVAGADGSAQLLHADGTAAQVGVVDGGLVFTEKSNAIETVRLDARGAITGAATMVSNIPLNADTPLGLATRGDDAYVTIAHSDETSLVRNGALLTLTPSGTQHAPCWLALDGPFLFSANSPSKSVSRYAVYGQQIVQDAAVAASFGGNPTDIAYKAGLAAVIDSVGTVSHVSVFAVDEDGKLTLRGVATLGSKATNGVAIVAGVAHR
jgi:6-phosphogluconolactonase (cycloisomerase 2 family)